MVWELGMNSKVFEMKKAVTGILIILTLIFSGSCRKALKNIDDYYPKITITATKQTDGSTLVNGTIQSKGAASIDKIGFCTGTMSSPNMVNKQVIVTPSGSSFSTVYTDFNVDSTYYFRGWATNKYGYVYSNTVSLDSIIAQPVIPSCSLILNTVNTGGGTPTGIYYTVSVPSNNMVSWSFTGQTATGHIVTFVFGSVITTGIYTTTINNSPASGQAYVSFYSGFISGVLNSGTKVYVNTIGSGVYDISICNAPWVYNSSTFYFDTRLKVPL